MSPVFRHGGLRLYLLKLLDEAPRHGYDVIRLLQDRFLGVYSPSPGTIYPRLARLEEEGLVTHDLIDGKKVYRITDAGREELNRRLDDLEDLEEELSASVRDIAREISRDVRETVRSMRDELTWAVREASRSGSGTTTGSGTGANSSTGAGADAGAGASAGSAARGSSAGAGSSAPGAGPATEDSSATQDSSADQAQSAASGPATGAGSPAGGSSAASAGSQAETGTPSGDGPQSQAGAGESSGEQAGPRQRPPGDWREWVDWAERHDWRDWAEWARQRNWSDWSSKQQAKGQEGRAGAREERPSAGPRDWRQPEWDLAADLERLAGAFARELRGVAWQAGTLSEDAVGALGRILTDALNRIRTEVFRAPEAADPKAKEGPTSDAAGGAPDDQTS